MPKCLKCDRDFKKETDLLMHTDRAHPKQQPAGGGGSAPPPAESFRSVRSIIRNQLEDMFAVQLIKFMERPFDPNSFKALSQIVNDKPQVDPLAVIERWEKIRSKAVESNVPPELNVEAYEGEDTNWGKLLFDNKDVIIDIFRGIRGGGDGKGMTEQKLIAPAASNSPSIVPKNSVNPLSSPEPPLNPEIKESDEIMKYDFVTASQFEEIKKQIRAGRISEDKLWDLMPEDEKSVIPRELFHADFLKIKEGKE